MPDRFLCHWENISGTVRLDRFWAATSRKHIRYGGTYTFRSGVQLQPRSVPKIAPKTAFQCRRKAYPVWCARYRKLPRVMYRALSARDFLPHSFTQFMFLNPCAVGFSTWWGRGDAALWTMLGSSAQQRVLMKEKEKKKKQLKRIQSSCSQPQCAFSRDRAHLFHFPFNLLSSCWSWHL